MNKLYYKLLTILVLVLAIGGCKVDAVDYGPDVKPSAEFLAGTAGTGGAPVNSTISYTLDGKTVNFTIGFFQVISPELVPPNGSLQVGGGLDPTTAFSLIAETTTTGTFDADIITIGKDLVGSGKVTFTEVNVTDKNGLKGTVKGTFTGKVAGFLSDLPEKEVSGSFSIKM